jgi:hypothetical protein
LKPAGRLKGAVHVLVSCQPFRVRLIKGLNAVFRIRICTLLT